MWHQAAGHTSPPMHGELNREKSGAARKPSNPTKQALWRFPHEGSGPMRMKVSDGKAREVCVAHKGDDKPCHFTPLFAQRYDIGLMNEGG